MRVINIYLFLVSLLILFYSCSETDSNMVNNSLIDPGSTLESVNTIKSNLEVETKRGYFKDSLNLDILLDKSSLELKIEKTTLTESDKLFFSLFEHENLGKERCFIEKWESGRSFFKIWRIELSEKKNSIALKSKIDSICNILMSEKISFEKKFRGYNLYENRFVLYKHNFFTEDEIFEFKELIKFAKKDFVCW